MILNKGLRRFALIIGCVLTPFAFLSSKLLPWGESWGPQDIIQEISYPIEYLWHSTVQKVSKLANRYVFLVDAAKENEELRQEIRLVQTRLIDYQEQLQENDRLRKLLDFSTRFQEESIVAEVIVPTGNHPFDVLRVSKGQFDRVHVGMPVIAADGVVGRVIRVGLKYSDVQPIVGANSHLDVLLQRTRVRGVLTGLDSSRCRLQLHRKVDIKIGDTVVTSGEVGGFPKGVPVGKVIRISYGSESIAQTVTVAPWVDHSRLEEVMILHTFDIDVEKIKESAGTNWIKSQLGEIKGG